MGPEAFARRDALSLVHFLIDRVSSEVNLRACIEGDATISKEVRAIALEQAGPFWETRQGQQAEAVVLPLLARGLLREEAFEAIRNDPQLGQDLKSVTLKLIEIVPESSGALDHASWEVVKLPGAAGCRLPTCPASGRRGLPAPPRAGLLHEHPRRGPVSRRSRSRGHGLADEVERAEWGAHAR